MKKKIENKYNWSGERLETYIVNDTMLEHLHRYAIAQELIKGKTVLEIGSGEGYGANLLADFALSVVGVDIDEKSIENAKNKYKKEKLTFITANAINIPFPDHTFDAVVCFETLEHLKEHEMLLTEIKRLLIPSGILIISTPDKLNYSDTNEQQNKFHLKELYAEDFKKLIKNYFQHTCYYEQISYYASIITGEINADVKVISGNYNKINQIKKFEPFYHIALASDNDILIKPNCPTIFNGLSTYNEIVEKAENSVKSTITYKTGHILLSPFKALKSFINKLVF